MKKNVCHEAPGQEARRVSKTGDHETCSVMSRGREQANKGGNIEMSTGRGYG